MVIPNYIRSKMHLCASHARQAAKYGLEVANWLEKHGVDVESISDGDDTSFDELLYGNDVTDELCHRFRENTSSSCNRCECVACQNRSEAVTYIASNRTLTEADIRALEAKKDV